MENTTIEEKGEEKKRKEEKGEVNLIHNQAVSPQLISLTMIYRHVMGPVVYINLINC